MRITIATGIFPPEIGGPAEYARNLSLIWQNNDHIVKVKVFSRFNFLPTGIRHLAYFFSIFPSILRTDLVIALDTYSSALPALIASKILGKKILIRTGGDFLWELYIQRTGDLVLLKDFYKSSIKKLNLKEKIIFKLTKFVLKNASAIIWSTEWQRDIFIGPYGLENQNNFIIENYYGKKEPSNPYSSKTFISSSRELILKNKNNLEKIFEELKKENTDLVLDTKKENYDVFMKKISNSYAVIAPSISEISPNFILDAIRMNKPFICTKEVGIYERIKNVGIYVDPLNNEDIKKAIRSLLEEETYQKETDKVRGFTFVHEWEDIAREFLEISNSVK